MLRLVSVVRLLGEFWISKLFNEFAVSEIYYECSNSVSEWIVNSIVAIKLVSFW